MSPAGLMKRFTDFLDEAHRLKSCYASQITLLVGLETEYINDKDLDMLSEILYKHSSRIEYIVGSVHHVHGIPIDFDRDTFDHALRSCVSAPNVSSSAHMDLFLSAYFDAQYALLKRFQPEIIGHLDLCRLYHPELSFSQCPSALSKLDRNISFAISYGALFEFNAAALRKGWGTSYPGRDVVEVREENYLSRLSSCFHLVDSCPGWAFYLVR